MEDGGWIPDSWYIHWISRIENETWRDIIICDKFAVYEKIRITKNRTDNLPDKKIEEMKPTNNKSIEKSNEEERQESDCLEIEESTTGVTLLHNYVTTEYRAT